MNWNDLTFLLAVARGNSLTRAARLLQVDKSTVSRRLAALEADLQLALVERAPDGRITLSDAGRQVVRRAERVEDEMQGLHSDLGRMRAIVGRVRITAVPLLVNRLLLPQLGELKQHYPDIALDLVGDARDLSLADFDADIALRLARPRDGGQAVIARRIGELDYGAYAAVVADDDLGWIGYAAHMQFLDHALAIEALAGREGQTRANLSVNDAETLLQAVLAGQGVSLLPRIIAGQMPELQERAIPDFAMPRREVWLLVRRDMQTLTRVKAVVDWLETLMQQTGRGDDTP